MGEGRGEGRGEGLAAPAQARAAALVTEGIDQGVGENSERGNEHHRHAPQPHDTAYSASASLDTQRPATALHSGEYAESSASAFASASATSPDSFSLYWYQNDPNGCPVRLLSSTGEVLWAASYTAWAEVDLLHTAAVDNPIRLQGQYADSETGLYYNRHRYFCPHAGQFISQDPLGLTAGDNCYPFAPNVLAWCDPLGLKCQVHHIIPKAKSHGFRTHPLVKAGKIDIVTDARNLMKLSGHSGGHTKAYYQAVRDALDAKMGALGKDIKDPAKARAAVYEVMDDLRSDIASGKLPLYNSKTVKAVP
jgi:RHS repeat-associated protein